MEDQDPGHEMPNDLNLDISEFDDQPQDFFLHKAEHETFLKDLAALKEKFTSLQAQGEITTFLGIDIVRKLSDWFTNHIATVDNKMGVFLEDKMASR
jgi:hemerythrin